MEQRVLKNAERAEVYSLSHGVCLTAKVYGDIGCENFKRALNKMLKRYPIFVCNLGQETDGERSLMRKQDKELEPVYYPYAEVNNIEKHIEKEERIPYDFVDGPLFKTIVFKGDERSVVVFMASPMIADAISLKVALETTVYYLNHAKEPVAEAACGRTARMDEERHILTMKDLIAIRQINRQWKRQHRTVTMEEYQFGYAAYHKSHDSKIMMKEIRKKSTQSLIGNCKKKEVSIDAALLTAFIAVVSSFDKVHFCRPIPIRYRIDLRERMAYCDPSEIGQLSDHVSFKRSYVLQESFWDNVKIMDGYLETKSSSRKQCLRGHLIYSRVEGSLVESLPLLSDQASEGVLARKVTRLIHRGNIEQGIELYSMKEIEYSREEEFYIDTMNVIPPARDYNDLTIGSCIVNGKLRLCIRYDKGHYSEHIVEEMVRTAVNYIWNRTETCI